MDRHRSSALGSNDGFSRWLSTANRGETRQFLTVPIGAETCGPIVLDDLVTVSVQHPGTRRQQHRRPAFELAGWRQRQAARPSIVAVWKDGGGIGV